ncbi:hypothetical protein DFJ73DRAFT_869846 [Zopfochytrium polystomum]|nr:hypothetical protein DFJ73DRAFT_869846 [Zopfochytrium polystomum]
MVIHKVRQVALELVSAPTEPPDPDDLANDKGFLEEQKHLEQVSFVGGVPAEQRLDLGQAEVGEGRGEDEVGGQPEVGEVVQDFARERIRGGGDGGDDGEASARGVAGGQRVVPERGLCPDDAEGWGRQGRCGCRIIGCCGCGCGRGCGGGGGGAVGEEVGDRRAQVGRGEGDGDEGGRRQVGRRGQRVVGAQGGGHCG